MIPGCRIEIQCPRPVSHDNDDNNNNNADAFLKLITDQKVLWINVFMHERKQMSGWCHMPVSLDLHGLDLLLSRRKKTLRKSTIDPKYLRNIFSLIKIADEEMYCTTSAFAVKSLQEFNECLTNHPAVLHQRNRN